MCAYDGVVVKVAQTGGYGKHVKVEHTRNGSQFFTWYCHLDAVYVSSRNILRVGDPIGEIGNTGNSSGEHIHFNLQAPGYGLSGYILPDVVDPLPHFE